MKRKKGFYSISVVAKMFSVHQQTIRLYEKEGLINPKRSAGNTRLFSEDDVDRLEEIIYLTHKLGVNLAGVEVILSLQKKINKLQKEINKLFEQTQGQLQEAEDIYKESAKRQAKRLVEMKKLSEKEMTRNVVDITESSSEEAKEKKQARKTRKASVDEQEAQTTLPVDVEIVDDWEVEYDDED